MKQRDIWLIDLDPARGAEIKKTRPCLIVNDDAIGKLPLRVIVPLTDWKERYDLADWMVKLMPSPSNKLQKESNRVLIAFKFVHGLRIVLYGRLGSSQQPISMLLK